MPPVRQSRGWVGVLLCLLSFVPARADVLSEWFGRSYPPPGGLAYSYALSGIVYGNNLFVAVGEYGDNGVIVTSPDGVTWTVRTNGGGNMTYSVQGIVSVGNGFVGVGWSGGLTTSSDGVNWSQSFYLGGSQNDYSGVAYGAGRYVAVGWGFPTETLNVAVSSGGGNWSVRTGARYPLRRVAYGLGVFLAVGAGGASSSVNGTNWVPRSSSFFDDVAYGNGTLVTCGPAGLSAWTPAFGFALTTNIPASAVTFGAGTFFAAASTNMFFTSSNGTNWTAHSVSPALSFTPHALAYGTGTLVAVGYPNKISQSARLAGIQPGAGAGTVRIQGIIGSRYGVEARDAFRTNAPWTSLANFTLTNSPQFWTDPQGTNLVQRFYRTRLLP